MGNSLFGLFFQIFVKNYFRLENLVFPDKDKKEFSEKYKKFFLQP